jgi:Na+/H+-dicarboxylate symporter
MKKFLKSYKSTIILLAAIIIGAIVGIVLQDKAAVLKPFGDIFLNLMFIVIVPLIFFSITSSIAKMKQPKRIGKVMISIVVAFIITSLIAVFVGVFSIFKISLVDVSDGEQIKSSLTTEFEETEENSKEDEEEPTILERTVDVLTVNDFQKLLSRNNIIAIIIVSIMVGIAIHMAGDKAEAFEKFIYSGNEVIMNLVKIIMYYAPIGLGCYIAALIGTFGSTIAVGYLKTFVIYTVVCLAFYVIIY